MLNKTMRNLFTSMLSKPWLMKKIHHNVFINLSIFKQTL
uniref:Uncharacterized protein n=1 Tax=Arundo donax TaxID=35708 RepID=A0A0A9PX01_ARUDO